MAKTKKDVAKEAFARLVANRPLDDFTPEPDPVPPDNIDFSISLKEKIFWGVLYGLLIIAIYSAIIWRALDG